MYGRPEHIYGVVMALAGLYKKVIAEKLLVAFLDLKWPWRHGEGSLVAKFRLRVSNLHVTLCLRIIWMVFFQKIRLSFFSL